MRLQRAISAIRSDGTRYALMMLDLDSFKPVNDVFGHTVGDELLIAFARRVPAVLGDAGTLARLWRGVEAAA